MKKNILLFVMAVTLTLSLGSSSLVYAAEIGTNETLSEEEMMKLFKEQSQKFKESGAEGLIENATDNVSEQAETEDALAEDSTENSEDITPEVVEADISPAVETTSTTDMMTEKAKSIGYDVSITPHAAANAAYDRPMNGYVPLGDIRLAVDMTNQTLLQIVDEIVTQASAYTGAWHVKWRLRKENEFLLNEKVNLTAESSFREFVDHLVDRVNNMTGIRLFVTIFETSRVIVISDTYY